MPSDKHSSYLAQTEAIRQALLGRAEEMFIAAFGEPTQETNHEWREGKSNARSMVMRGTKRGLWCDHSSGEGGDLFDLVAVYHCGLTKSKDNFPKVREVAAGLVGFSLDSPMDPKAVQKMERHRERDEKQRERRTREDDRLRKKQDARLLAKLINVGQPVTPETPPGRYLLSRAITEWPEVGLCWCPPLKGVRVRGNRHHSLVLWAWPQKEGMPVGGQRILLKENGKRITNEVAKLAFGRLKGHPARLPSIQDNPHPSDTLLVAEGPEGALSAWLATGYETWAVFGSSFWRSAPLPSDRPVILCPDRDPPGKAAELAFRRAVEHHRKAGIQMKIAIAPEPEGSKHDLNDTLQERGGDTVLKAIQAAQPVTDNWPAPPTQGKGEP